MKPGIYLAKVDSPILRAYLIPASRTKLFIPSFPPLRQHLVPPLQSYQSYCCSSYQPPVEVVRLLPVVAAVGPCVIVLSTVPSNAIVVPLPLVAIGRWGWSRILHFRVLIQRLFASKTLRRYDASDGEQCSGNASSWIATVSIYSVVLF